MRRKAVEFLRRIGEDAERFEAMSQEDYAAHKHAELMANPFRRYRIMAQEAGPTKAEVADRFNSMVLLPFAGTALWAVNRRKPHAESIYD
jgi:hypothetical protein